MLGVAGNCCGAWRCYADERTQAHQCPRNQNPSLATASPYIRAYLLASAVQEGVDVEWWVNVNRDNIHAAEVLVELMLGPWVRPQFRAAYALQMLNDQLRNMGITEASKLSTSEGLHRLLDAIIVVLM